MNAIAYRSLRADDTHPLLALFERVRPSIARQKHRAVYRAAIADALAGRHLLIFVAERDGDLVGYSILAFDWHRFRVGFVLRHPRVALLTGAGWLRRQRRRGRPQRTPVTPRPSTPPDPEERQRRDASESAAASAPAPSWDQGGPQIAKVIYTGVDPAVRSQGIGSGLKAFYVEELKRRGIRRVDALIEGANEPSLALQRRQGWSLVPRGKDTFAYMWMDHREETAPP